jgi:glycosyltransferase involved in cell wall biosynthesis
VRFAYIGGLAWQKGVHVVIQAFRQLHGPVELWIVGDESANPAYVADLRANSNESVRFLGSLPHVEVWKILGQVDAVLVPSLWYETFSLITHEALAAGVPVIASHHGVLADAIRHGVDGMLVTAGDVSGWRDALQEAVTNPACLAHLRSGVRPPLSQKDHMDHLERVYHEILTSNRSPLYTDE